jgi:hypothetical protein
MLQACERLNALKTLRLGKVRNERECLRRRRRRRRKKRRRRMKKIE